MPGKFARQKYDGDTTGAAYQLRAMQDAQRQGGAVLASGLARAESTATSAEAAATSAAEQVDGAVTAVTDLEAGVKDGSVFEEDTFTGVPIVGPLIATATTGPRVEINSTPSLAGQVLFRSGDPAEDLPGSLKVFAIAGTNRSMSLAPPRLTGDTSAANAAQVTLYNQQGASLVAARATRFEAAGRTTTPVSESVDRQDGAGLTLGTNAAGTSTSGPDKAQMAALVSTSGILLHALTEAITVAATRTRIGRSDNAAGWLEVDSTTGVTMSSRTGTLSLASGVSGIAEGPVVRQAGGTVFLGIALTFTATKAAATSLLTVPTDFRPTSRVRLTMFYEAPGTGALSAVFGYLETDGNLYCYSGLGAGAGLYGHAVWVR